MSLTNKFIFVILFITTLIVSVFTYLQITEQKKILKNELNQRIDLMNNNIELNAKHIINTLKYDVENDIASFNFSHIDISFRKLMNNPNIQTINMHNIDKNVNLIIGDKNIEQYIHQDDIQKLTITKLEHRNSFVISVPLHFSQKWGTLHIVYSLHNLKKAILKEERHIIEKINKSIQKAIYTAIILALLIIFFAYIFTRKFLLPILSLTEIAKHITNGKMDVNNEFETIKREDEIGVLYNTFKEMSTQLENSYKKLQKLNENLEAKVMSRTNQLNLEKQKAEKATKVKSEFLATMSHEIRTPMNGILGMAYLALETSLDSQQKNYITKIEKSATSLMRIINDILDFSKLEATKLTIIHSQFNLLKLIQNVINILKIEADKKDVKLLLNYDISQKTFNGDSLRINQILTNIIGNAIKFTDKGTIEINISNIGVNRYRFSIDDTGIGLTEEQIEKLFKSFSQADTSTTRKYGGTGLGLVISKQLANLMNGDIWVERKKGKGSIFHIEIELDSINIIDNKVPYIKNKFDISTLSKARILVVEDNTINQEIIAGLLENSSITIDFANNGQEAIDLFDTNIHKLILMDIEMPIMNGIEATKIIRKKDQSIPIIALTANAMITDVSQSKEMGMNEHLNKPIDINQLHSILEKYLSHNTKKETLKIDSSINYEIGLQYLNNNEKLYNKILKNFFDTYKNLNLNSLDKTQNEIEIHTLKGLSKNIGAEKLFQIINNLEPKETFANCEIIQKELLCVIEELSRVNFIEQQNDLVLTELSLEQKETLFHELYNAIKQKKPKLCNITIQEIQKYKLSDYDTKIFENTKHEITQYNFKQAEILIEELLKYTRKS